jgi:hypothetical protein
LAFLEPAIACGETMAPAIVNDAAAMPSANLVFLCVIVPPQEVVILQKFALLQQNLFHAGNISIKPYGFQVFVIFFLYQKIFYYQ